MRNSSHPDPLSDPACKDQAYLRRRADAHRQLAEKAKETEARSVHLRLALLYEEQARLISLVVSD